MKNLTLGMLPKFFLVTSIYVGTMSFHFRNISPLKIFHRHRQRHRHRRSTHFLKFGLKLEINCFSAEIFKIENFFKTYTSLGTNALQMIRCGYHCNRLNCIRILY